MDPEISPARNRLLWWTAYILLVLVLIVSTWALADF
jgi:hypothetical protein